MRTLLVALIFITLSGKLFAQQPVPPPPLPFREVSGVVKDEKGETVPGATITLKSVSDTINTSSNEDGIFVFKNVKKAAFNLTVTNMGSETFLKKYLNSDVAKKLVLDPITLKPSSNQLNEVKINGTPSIVYKTDTVEYRASDYKVRENSTVDELLKKMEGMEVGTDGSLVHQGENVVQAKLNGKVFSGGSIAQAIKNLPADIVEKIQIVDDYGDQAARTGVKTGMPNKILNITTKPDRSVGTTGRTTLQAGSHGRYNANISLQRINANQVINIIGNIRSTVEGIGGGNPGTTDSGSPSISYRDQWSKKVQVNTNFSSNYNHNESQNMRYGFDNGRFGPTTFSENGTNESKSKGMNGSFQIEIQADSSNFIQISPNFGKSSSSSNSFYRRDQVDDFTDTAGNSLFQHRLSVGTNFSSNDNKNFGIGGLFVHTFKPRRSISINVNASRNESESSGGSDKTYNYFADSTQNIPLTSLDSAINILTRRNNNSNSMGASATYTEPISLLSLLELRSEFSRNKNDVQSLQYEDNGSGVLTLRQDLSNVFNYSVTQSRYNASYRYDGKKVQMSLGVTGIAYNLTGARINNSTGQYANSSRSTFKVVPSFRFSYMWTRTQRLQLNYNAGNSQPDFQQIQPFTDRTNPLNIVIGNPNLNPAFNHSINGSYNNYIANSRFNISLSGYANFYPDRITNNTLIKVVNKVLIRETYYLNLDGSHSYGGNYGVSKQLDDRRYNISLNGGVNYDFNTALDNNRLYHVTSWRFNERFGPRINPNDNIEVNPYVGYNLTRTFTTLPSGRSTLYQTFRFAIDGRMYFKQTYQFNYSASKNFVKGIQNSTNPFVVNMGFQKEFLKKRNLVFTLDVYDVFNQNNFIRQDPTSTGGQISTISSTLSRYFMAGIRLNLQKWSGRPQRNGKNMQRRGDGSFIYN
ncbi:outer membrane beta-barrel protein [Mucilaginibacter antarcticus]|uniref:Outer membrane beta-barrel protein n=2 Tax=Mucilaginibacter antarcticus TaxID=1855725 RepID=A0ABW5XJA9_9SPHI